MKGSMMFEEKTQYDWNRAAGDMISRMEQTAAALDHAFPHWANGQTGVWTTTPDGDWTGGAWPGMLWLAHRMTGNEKFHELARTWCLRLRPRAKLETAFKGFGFYCGAALGQILTGDETGKTVALEAAESLRNQFDPRLGLIPLGKDAEEHGEIGKAFSSIDSLQAAPLLFWAASQTGEDSYRERAGTHTTRGREKQSRSKPRSLCAISSTQDWDSSRWVRMRRSTERSARRSAALIHCRRLLCYSGLPARPGKTPIESAPLLILPVCSIFTVARTARLSSRANSTAGTAVSSAILPTRDLATQASGGGHRRGECFTPRWRTT